MIIVTGGAGFIGSNIIKGLNKQGLTDIMVVDDLTDGSKYKNLVDCDIYDYMDKDAFTERLEMHCFFDRVKAIFHQAACSTTTEWNGKFMMKNNFELSKLLLLCALKRGIPFIYASSAAVYGNGSTFEEQRKFEEPVNVYGYSKFLFDQVIRFWLQKESVKEHQLVGLRYFNVYGPNEQHKGSMASVPFHLNNQVLKDGHVRLFEGSDGYADGEQRRDFVYVDDVVDVNLWFLKNRDKRGIFNLGTGQSRSFNDVANAVLNWHGRGHIQYIPFPEHLRGHYQSYTQADISALKNVGYKTEFKTVEQGVKLYLDQINKNIKSKSKSKSKS